MQPERAGVRRIDQRRRIAGAHLEKDAGRKFTQRLPPQKPADVIECVAREQDMKTMARSFGDQRLQHRRRVRTTFGGAARETEFILLPQLLEILQSMYDQECGGILLRLLARAGTLQVLR